MQIAFDETKRTRTLAERGLDFADAVHVFAGATLDQIDQRENYGEQRVITMGMLAERVVVIVWTPRGAVRRIISMRYANERERQKF